MAIFDRQEDRLVVRVVYDGPENAGKTENLRRLQGFFTPRRRSELVTFGEALGRTTFFDWLQLEGGLVLGCSMRCQLVTVPGHGRFEARRLHLIRSADVVVFVCDSTPDGVADARAPFAQLEAVLAAEAAERGQAIPLVLQANKQDAPGALSPAEVASALQAPLGTEVVSARASDGTGVRETVVLAIRAAANLLQETLRSSGVPSLAGSPERPEDLHAALCRLSGTHELAPRADGSPALPSADLPAELTWPPVRGQELLRRAIAGGEVTAHPELAGALGTADGSGRSDVHVVECGSYCLKTARRRWRPDLDGAQALLRDVAARKELLGDLLPRRTALVLAPDPAGGYWLWTISPWLTTLRGLMSFAERRKDATTLGETLAAYARVSVTCMELAARRGVSLDVHPSNFAVLGESVFYLDDDIDLGKAMPLLPHALVRRAEEYEAWEPSIELYLDELERSMCARLTGGDLAELGLRRALEATPVRSAAAVRTKQRLLDVIERLPSLPMRLALLADVHANLPALQAVFAAIADAAPDVLVCLGDLVGYNAEPAACVDLLKARGVRVVAGNHDLDVATSTRSMGTTGIAAIVQDWTRAALGEARCRELAALPRMLRVSPDVVAVHGSFLNETHVTGYVTSTMLEKNLHALRGRWDARVGFCGHTHAPMIGWLDEDGARELHPTLEVEWPEGAQAVLINPGSVGQPRDHNPWSSFAVVDLEARRVRFERVPYDVAAATAAIDRAGLPQELAARLREGR